MTDDKEQFVPGSFGCHEVLHMASFLAEAVDDKLCEHPAIKANPEWLSRANTAQAELMDLYNAIGYEHFQAADARSAQP